ncbi:hypothetical protein ACWEF6_12470 [Amycolatopsis sp. NPDC004772]
MATLRRALLRAALRRGRGTARRAWLRVAGRDDRLGAAQGLAGRWNLRPALRRLALGRRGRVGTAWRRAGLRVAE